MKQNRVFEKKLPSKSAKKVFIFCEGSRTELMYYRFFEKRDSRIDIQIYNRKSYENNSPTGLFALAKNCFESSTQLSELQLYRNNSGFRRPERAV